jgi:hypothetical protein
MCTPLIILGTPYIPLERSLRKEYPLVEVDISYKKSGAKSSRD